MAVSQKKFGAAGLVLATAMLFVSRSASAQEADEGSAGTSRDGATKTAATETPTVAYTYTAFGVSARTFGAAGYGESRGGFESTPVPHLGGGLRLWASPVDRVTLFIDAEQRDENDKFAPSASIQVRILGNRADGWALGALARYKAEGFADLGGEIEFAALGSYGRRGVHLDGNAVIGKDMDKDESDGEALARAGYDVLTFLRVGGEGRVRYRLSGAAALPGGRNWDAFAGPQVMGFYGAFFGAVTAGPSTIGLTENVGWIAIATVGGAAF